MCLLITQKSTSPALSDEWLKNFYSFNSDGVGVMHSENGVLIIEKALPKNASEFIDFYRSHIQGKNCAYHLRMRTHGDIDLGNCHPYEVLNRPEHGMNLWLMHNGILSTGNANDPKKSDTWHYIVDFLRPMLKDNPSFVYHPAFSEIVSKHIGNSNKFVLMNDAGHTITINEDQGVYWAGLWLSNEYAWSASDSASDKPVDDPKIALDQANEKPIVKSYYSTGKITQWYDQNNQIDYYGTGDQLERDSFIETYLDEFMDLGYKDAGQLSFYDIDGFIDTHGENSFYDLADLLLDGKIIEWEFVKAIRSPYVATKYFPFLEIESETI